MPTYGKVMGRFFTHQRIGDPVPLGGAISFTPSSFAKSGDTLYGAVTRRGYVVDGVLCSDPEGKLVGVDLLVPGEGVEPSSWTYEVQGRLADDAGRTTLMPPFNVEVTSAGVDLVDALPVQSSTGQWVTRGENGVGIADITAEGGQIIFHLTDGQTTSIPVPGGVPGADGAPGADGRGVASILDDDRDGSATVTYTDGSTSDLPLPPGPQGAPGPAGEPGPAGLDGRSVVSITDTDGDGIATVLYSDDAREQLPLPAGPPGKDGASATPQDTGWRDVTTLVTTGTGLASGSIYVRRIGNNVLVEAWDARFTVATGNIAANTALAGFTRESLRSNERIEGYRDVWFLNMNGSIMLRAANVVGNGSTANFLQTSYITTAPWPSTLPGTAA